MRGQYGAYQPECRSRQATTVGNGRTSSRVSSDHNLLSGLPNRARASRPFYTRDYFTPNSTGAAPAGRSSAARNPHTSARTASVSAADAHGPIFPAPAEGGNLQKGLVGLEAEEVAADGLEVGLAALELLGHGVDVGEAALECAAREDGARAGGVVHGVHDLLGLVDAVGGGQADLHPLLQVERAARSAHLRPDAGQRVVQEDARRAQLRLGLGHLELDDAAVAQLPLGRARLLVAGQLDEGVEAAPRDAHRHAGEASCVEAAGGEAVERTGVPALGRIVARDGVLARHEEICDRERVAP